MTGKGQAGWRETGQAAVLRVQAWIRQQGWARTKGIGPRDPDETGVRGLGTDWALRERERQLARERQLPRV